LTAWLTQDVGPAVFYAKNKLRVVSTSTRGQVNINFGSTIFDPVRRLDYDENKKVGVEPGGQIKDKTGQLDLFDGVKLGRFCRWLDGNLSDFTLQAVRAYVSELQRAMKFDGLHLSMLGFNCCYQI